MLRVGIILANTTRLMVLCAFMILSLNAQGQNASFIPFNPAVYTPVDGCDLGEQDFTVIVWNKGSVTIPTNDCTLRFSVNGVEIGSGTPSPPVTPGGTGIQQLADDFDFIDCQDYEIKVWIDWPADTDPTDDTISWTITNDCTIIPGTISGSTRVCDDNNSGQLYLDGWQNGTIDEWYVSSDLGATFSGTAQTTDTYNYLNVSDTLIFEVPINGGFCPNDTVRYGHLGIDSLTIAPTLSSDILVSCLGDDTVQFMSTGYRSLLLGYEFSQDGAAWTRVLDGRDSIDTLLVTNTYVRSVAVNGSCPEDVSNEILITIDQHSVAGIVDYAAYICAGKDTGFVSVSGYTGNFEDWLFSNDSINWYSLGVTTDSITYSDLNEPRFYMYIVKNGVCPADTGVYFLDELVVSVNADYDTTIIEGESVQLTSSGGVTAEWSPQTGLDDPYSYTPVASPTTTTQYIMYALDQNFCLGFDTVTITVINVDPWWISNALTPNGDGSNDTWYISSLDNFPGTTVEIYNLYGQQVYKSEDYDNSWQGEGIMGTQPNGTYYYVVNRSDGRLFKGTILLLNEQ